MVEENNNINTTVIAKKFSFWKFIKRLFMSVFLLLFFLISTSITLVIIYEDDVKNIIINELNKYLNTEVKVNPEDINLTIINTFPDCALEFKNVLALETFAKKNKDTLLFAKRLALEFNVKDLFYKNYTIKSIVIENATANLKVNKKGETNYNVWKSNSSNVSSDDVKFELQKIKFTNVDLSYKNVKNKFKIETTIKDLVFKGKFNSDNYVLSAKGKTFINTLQADKVTYLNQKQVNLNVELKVENNTYSIIKSETTFNATQITSNGSFIIKDSLSNLDINFNAKNLDIASSLSLLPEKFQSQISEYKSTGEFYAKGKIHYSGNNDFTLKSEFGINNANITYQPKNTTLTSVNLNGEVEINEKRTVLKLKNISAQLNNNQFNGDVELSNFKDPYLKLKIKANTKLEELIQFYPIDTLQNVSGAINLDATIEGLISDMKSNAFSPNINANGEAMLSDLKASFKNSTQALNIIEGKLSLNNRHLNVFGLKFSKGKSDIMLVGEMPNFLGYLFNESEPLTIIANVASDNIEVEDFLFPSGSSNSTSEINLSDKLILNISVNAQKLSFGKFSANLVKGELMLKNQKIAIQNTSLGTCDGQLNLNSFIDASGNVIKVSGHADMNNLNIQKLFYQLNNFSQNTIQDKNIKGFVTSSTDFSCIWDKKLNLDLNSIAASTNLTIERGELIGLKTLESLGKYIDVNELMHIKFSNLQSNIDIKNKIISIPKTSIKSSAINLELWGKHTFNNDIDYHIQLLISELISKKPRKNKELDEELALIENDAENRRSVFILMTGTVDNPIIKYDKKGAKEKIREDIKQEKQNLKQLLKEEFGLFKKDTIKTKQETSNQKFDIQFGDEKPKQTKPLQPKKKEEDDDDF